MVQTLLILEKEYIFSIVLSFFEVIPQLRVRKKSLRSGLPYGKYGA
jgi:hypothetical protein